jgi:hypothetical protein
VQWKRLKATVACVLWPGRLPHRTRQGGPAYFFAVCDGATARRPAVAAAIGRALDIGMAPTQLRVGPEI